MSASTKFLSIRTEVDRIQDGGKATSVSWLNSSVKRIFAASSLSLCKECSPSSIAFLFRKKNFMSCTVAAISKSAAKWI